MKRQEKYTDFADGFNIGWNTAQADFLIQEAITKIECYIDMEDVKDDEEKFTVLDRALGFLGEARKMLGE